MKEGDGQEQIVEIVRDVWKRDRAATPVGINTQAKYPNMPNLGSSDEELVIQLPNGTTKTIIYSSPHYGKWEIMHDKALHETTASLSIMRKKLTESRGGCIPNDIQDREQHKGDDPKIQNCGVETYQYIKECGLRRWVAQIANTYTIPQRFLKPGEPAEYSTWEDEYIRVVSAEKDTNGIAARCPGKIIGFHSTFSPSEHGVVFNFAPAVGGVQDPPYPYQNAEDLLYILDKQPYRPHVRHELWERKDGRREQHPFSFFSYTPDQKLSFAPGIEIIGDLSNGLYYRQERQKTDTKWEELWTEIKDPDEQKTQFELVNIPDGWDGMFYMPPEIPFSDENIWLYKKACDGDTEAQYRIAHMYLEKKNIEKAVEWFIKSGTEAAKKDLFKATIIHKVELSEEKKSQICEFLELHSGKYCKCLSYILNPINDLSCCADAFSFIKKRHLLFYTNDVLEKISLTLGYFPLMDDFPLNFPMLQKIKISSTFNSLLCGDHPQKYASFVFQLLERSPQVSYIELESLFLDKKNIESFLVLLTNAPSKFPNLKFIQLEGISKCTRRDCDCPFNIYSAASKIGEFNECRQKVIQAAKKFPNLKIEWYPDTQGS